MLWRPSNCGAEVSDISKDFIRFMDLYVRDVFSIGMAPSGEKMILEAHNMEGCVAFFSRFFFKYGFSFGLHSR